MFRRRSGQGAALTIALRALAFGILAISPMGWAYAQANAESTATTAPSAASDAASPANSGISATLATPTAPVTTAGVVLPANTVVELEMVDAVSSKTSKRDDFFKLRVATDVKSGNVVLIPAGTPVVGQIVHAAKSGGGGKPGELILAARYIDMPQGQIKLHSSFGAAGKDRTNASMAASFALGVFALAIKGKEIELPVGSALSARTAADTSFAATP